MSQPNSRPPEILRLGEVQRRTGLSRSAVYEQMASEQFPKAVRIGRRAVGWLAAEIDQWITRRVAERDAA